MPGRNVQVSRKKINVTIIQTGATGKTADVSSKWIGATSIKAEIEWAHLKHMLIII